ncbi:Crp/Fnr family transcriptional regulator [Polaribacter sp.]|uniref:Crp/Fnr family transcriptional regulator n=1 Tax=Polaribacter sp. TaxID=1920175 RepID=UPI003F6B62E5
MENLISYLDAFQRIPKESKQILLNLVQKPLNLKKGEILSEVGSIEENMYILDAGVVRSYYIIKKEKKQTRNLFIAQRPLGPLGALILDKKSKFSYDCLTDCRVYPINFKAFRKLASKDQNISKLYINILENIFLELETRIFDLSALDATERYLKLKRKVPKIENLVTQYHIASFLNITPVQLSRIRRDLVKSKKK